MAYSSYLQPGTVLDGPDRKYRIVKTLGQGGFGITYLAETSVMVGNIAGRLRFAIKEHFISTLCSRDMSSQSVIIFDQNSETVTNSLHAFVKEARRLQDLGITHPNIVKVNEVFEANNTAYYVMEYLEGESLEDYVKRVGALSESETRELLLPLLHAVAQLHRNRVAHYDIKPQNIMLTKGEDGRLKPTLIDFGLAKHYDNQGNATSSIMAAGYTPGYAPIEQCMGISEYTPQCDVYALGGTLYYAMTGNTPAVAYLLKTAQIDAELQNIASDNMRGVIVRALQREIDDRYADATKMFDELSGNQSMSYTVTAGQTIRGNGKDAAQSYATAPMPAPSQTTVPKPAPNYATTPRPVNRPSTPPVSSKKAASTSKTKIYVFAFLIILIVAGMFAALALFPSQDSASHDISPGREKTTLSGTASNSGETKGIINGYEWVDLGLSVKWATRNIGASKPSDSGKFYAWGETSTKSDYVESNSATHGKEISDISGNSSYDAARYNWRSTWRVPTIEEFSELKELCVWTWTTLDGVNGYNVKGPNGNEIFLPATGYRDATGDHRVGEWGVYWSSTPHADGERVREMRFSNSEVGIYYTNRYSGQSIRPVSD